MDCNSKKPYSISAKNNLDSIVCLQLQLQNLVTGEKYDFSVEKWLMQTQDEGEISQELPVLHQGQPILPGKIRI